MQLYNKILLALVLGIVAGVVATLIDVAWFTGFLIAIRPIGTAWIRLITMIVVPLVVASLLVGTVSLGDLRKLGRIGGKTLVYYMSTTAVAVTIGLLVSNVIRPGSGIDESTRDSLAAQYSDQAAANMTLAAEKPSTVEILLNMIPRNPVQAAAEMDLLALIVFTVIFGAALTLIDPPKKGSCRQLLRRGQSNLYGHDRLDHEAGAIRRLRPDRGNRRRVRFRPVAEPPGVLLRSGPGATSARR